MRTDFLDPAEAPYLLRLLTPANSLICRIALKYGLRVGDIVGLRTAQLSERMFVREQKTGKTRRIYLPVDLREELLVQAGEVYVFPSRCDAGKHRSRQAVWYDMKRARKALRSKENLAPHSLRKTYAVELFRKTGDLEKVQKALNHDNINTTLIYAFSDKMGANEGKKAQKAGQKGETGRKK